MQKRIGQLTAVLCILAGAAISAYGLASLIDLDSFGFGKFTAEAKDTNGAILVLLIGLAMMLFGWFSGSGNDEASGG